ncbi:MAG: rRNA maturation RNase YbeY [Bacilli bacterium]|jgi:probable rRNA maturation factor
MIKIKTIVPIELIVEDIKFEELSNKISLAFAKNIKKKSNVTVVIIDTKKMKEMNYKYRMKDYATDVLSFEAEEDKYLGDIFICLEKIYEQAQKYNHSNEREYAFLLVHGILHLLGFDHETSEQEKEMLAIQERILNDGGFKR